MQPYEIRSKSPFPLVMSHHAILSFTLEAEAFAVFTKTGPTRGLRSISHLPNVAFTIWILILRLCPYASNRTDTKFTTGDKKMTLLVGEACVAILVRSKWFGAKIN